MNKVVAGHSVEDVSDNERVHAGISFPEKFNDDSRDHNETGQGVSFGYLIDKD